jgi:uncharacterized protein (DUF849 family)
MSGEAVSAGISAPLAIAVAPNGARKTKADHPALPIAPDELAATARACRDAGAAMIHLHVRDDSGGHSLDPGRYREAMKAVHDTVSGDLVIQITTEAVGRFSPAEQMATVREVMPEAVSLAVRELIPDAAHEAEAGRFLAWCREAGVSPQYILYDADDLARLRDLQARGIVPGAAAFRLYVLGRYAAGQRSEPADLLPFVTAPGGLDGPWALCAFGPRETACATAAAALGGHVRVGFENNLYLPDGTRAPDNAALVRAAAQGASAIGRPLADAAALRAAMAGWV